MTVESVTYISDLDDTYPAAGDPVSQGDDHVRNIKTGLLNSFPGVTGAVSSTHTELNYLDITTLGTGAAQKAVVPDSSGDYTWPSGGTLTYDTLHDGVTELTATVADLNGLTYDGPTVQIYTSDDTWTKPTGLKFIIVECVGGGGAGGGAGVTSTSEGSGGSGGGGGGYVREKIAAGSLNASEAVTVGAGGSGNSGATGDAGDPSSFGTSAYCTAGGGAGGVYRSALGYGGAQSGAGGSAADGDINAWGGAGGPGIINVFSSSVVVFMSGAGGNSYFGAGARGAISIGSTGGYSASTFGGGGGGAANGASQATPQAGGNGSAGIVIVWEYY